MKITEIKKELKIIIIGLANAMEDEFDKYYLTDIHNVIVDLTDLEYRAKGKWRKG